MWTFFSSYDLGFWNSGCLVWICCNQISLQQCMSFIHVILTLCSHIANCSVANLNPFATVHNGSCCTGSRGLIFAIFANSCINKQYSQVYLCFLADSFLKAFVPLPTAEQSISCCQHTGLKGISTVLTLRGDGTRSERVSNILSRFQHSAFPNLLLHHWKSQNFLTQLSRQ